MIGIDAIRARAEDTLRLVGELERSGVIGPAPAAALRRSLGGMLVPPSAVSVRPRDVAAALDELRDAAAAHLVAPNVDTAQRLADLVGGA